MKILTIIYLTSEPELQKFSSCFAEFETKVIESTWDPALADQILQNLNSKNSDAFCFLGLGNEELLHKLNLLSLAPLIQKSFQESLPMGAIGLGRLLVASALKKQSVTLASSSQESLINPKLYSHVLWETCPEEDFISDRETKVVSHCGFRLSDLESQKVQLGLHRFAQELFEWA